MDIAKISIDNKYLIPITTTLTSFHTLTHISYALTKHYPTFRSNNLIYLLYYSTDFFSFLSLYKILDNKFFLYWFYWHLVKLFDGIFDKNQTLRKLSIVNSLEPPSYLYAWILLNNIKKYKNYKYLGFLLFTILRYNNLCW